LDLAKCLLPLGARRRLRSWSFQWFPQLRYPWWITNRVRERRVEYAAPAIQDLFSLLTPVFNTPPRFLRELADSVFAQDYPWFEWVIVDNGSTLPSTRAILGRLTLDPRVKLISLGTNCGIIAGMRTALAQASGRYVVPADHDDRLYPDALRVMASQLHEHDYPAAAYSDEDKLSPNGRPCRPFCKPNWDSLFLTNCCYVAHLAAFARETAHALDFYTDSAAEGCPDWDAFLRLARAGHVPLHVPEILYSWRMHAGSTAKAFSGAKPYTLECQYHVLSQHLQLLNLDDRLAIRANHLLGSAGLWRIARRHVGPTPPIHVFWTGDGDCPEFSRTLSECTYSELRLRKSSWHSLQSAIRNLQSMDLVAVVQEDGRLLSADWPWEALGLFELHEDLAVLGGRFLDVNGRIRSAGEVFGIGGLLGSPCRGWPAVTPRRHGRLICQRTVSAVDGTFFIARAGFLATALAERPQIGRTMIAAWLAAAARRQNLRIGYSPHILLKAAVDDRLHVSSDEEIAEFLQEHWTLLKDDPYYSRYCSLRPGQGWRLTAARERGMIENIPLRGTAQESVESKRQSLTSSAP
jgi:glycosyltransferase involved in cell wall biosynthesis